MKTLFITTLLITSLSATAQLLNLAPSTQENVMARIMDKVIPQIPIEHKSTVITYQHTLRSTEIEAVINDNFKIDISKKTLNLQPVTKLSSPELIEFDSKKYAFEAAGKAKVFQSTVTLVGVPNVKPLAMVHTPVIEQPHSQIKDIAVLKTSDFKILEALIYLDDHKNYGHAMALLAEVMNSGDYKYDALYGYALTAQALKLNSEFRYNMMKVAKEANDPVLQQEATEALVTFVESLEITDMKELEPLVAKFEINTIENDAYNFYRAKYFLEEGHLGQVEDALLFISEKSKYYADALLISAIYNYRRGKVDDTIYDFTRLAKLTTKKDRLQGIAALTLARAYFQKGLYKEAAATYLKVNKADPVWTQAMVEQAWTQILLQDYEGAAGNMFTLHTDYFKNSFAPESYVVRAVGYLNLCQYGDGIQVLGNLNRKYGPFKEMLGQYKSAHKDNISYYDTVKKWFKNPEQRDVDGLPRSFIIEIARHPSFMKIQNQINNFEDEIEGFTKATINIIQRETFLIKKQTEAKNEIAKIQKLIHNNKTNSAQLKLDLNQQEKKLTAYKMQQQLANRARGLIKGLREKAIVRIEKEKVGLRDKAGKALKERVTTILADLKRILDQNEVLQYELYSGAGEHIRYQMAGGETKDNKKRTDDKQVSWKFQGEIWEDEVGHVKSSLENVCPKEDSNVAAK